MENKTQSPQFLKQRKLMMALPLLVLPFLTFAFWMLGGGQEQTITANVKSNLGLNLQLPDANLKEEIGFDKLSFYKAADEDSLKREQMIRNDPYYKDSIENGVQAIAGAANLASKYDHRLPLSTTGINTSPYSSNGSATKEQQLYQKIGELNKQINQPETVAYPRSFSEKNNDGEASEQFSKDVNRLHDMIGSVANKQAADPEMEQLNGTLEKILDIQNPERVREKIREQSLKQTAQVFTVNSSAVQKDDSYFPNEKLPIDTTIPQATLHNRFYDLGEQTENETAGNAIAAVVHETQIITAGSTVKLRLLSDVFINGRMVPMGSFVYGNASLENERLNIIVPSIRYKDNLLPVSLSVYDMDGMAGVYVPGSINRDVAKGSTDQSLQSLGLASLDQSLAAQATSAGVQTAKSLLSKKVKLIKVTVKAGYKVLLKDNNKQNY